MPHHNKGTKAMVGKNVGPQHGWRLTVPALKGSPLSSTPRVKSFTEDSDEPNNFVGFLLNLGFGIHGFLCIFWDRWEVAIRKVALRKRSMSLSQIRPFSHLTLLCEIMPDKQWLFRFR